MKLSLSIIALGVCIIGVAILIEVSSQRATQAEMNKPFWAQPTPDEASAERLRLFNLNLQRQSDAIERASKERIHQLELKQREYEWQQKRAELWKSAIDSSNERLANQVEQLRQEYLEAEKQKAADDAASEKAVREFNQRLGK